MPKLRKSASRKSLALTAISPVLGLKRFAVISAVEGLKLTPKGRKRVASGASTEKRRADVLKAYLDLKGSTVHPKPLAISPESYSSPPQIRVKMLETANTMAGMNKDFSLSVNSFDDGAE